MPLTQAQQTLLTAIHRELERDDAVEATWLSGSLGRGAGDAFSDVDVLVLVGADDPAEVGRRYVRDVARIAEPVLVSPLYGARVVSVVTADWDRFDLSFIAASDLPRFEAARLTVLFNKGGRQPSAPPSPPYAARPETLSALVNEFLRVLGLLPVGLGRGEWTLGLAGTDILRRLILDLMLEDNGVSPADRGGALRRYPLLTADQRRALDDLAPVEASRDGLIAANLALAAIFLPRARALAERIGMAWPTAFEAATRRRLRDALGMVLP